MTTPDPRAAVADELIRLGLVDRSRSDQADYLDEAVGGDPFFEWVMPASYADAWDEQWQDNQMGPWSIMVQPAQVLDLRADGFGKPPRKSSSVEQRTFLSQYLDAIVRVMGTFGCPTQWSTTALLGTGPGSWLGAELGGEQTTLVAAEDWAAPLAPAIARMFQAANRVAGRAERPERWYLELHDDGEHACGAFYLHPYVVERIASVDPPNWVPPLADYALA